MDGLYYDQIACMFEEPCYDRNHNHTIGGGNHWVHGHYKLLQKTKAKIGNNALIVTEDNREEY